MNTILLVLGFLSLSIPSQGVPLGKGAQPYLRDATKSESTHGADSPGTNVPPVVPAWIGQQDGMKCVYI